MNGSFSHCEICNGNHDADQCQDLKALRAMACSRPILDDLVLAIERYAGGASMMHPRLTRTLIRAKDHLRGTSETEGSHYGPPIISENAIGEARADSATSPKPPTL
jgi:hypothetical protein